MEKDKSNVVGQVLFAIGILIFLLFGIIGLYISYFASSFSLLLALTWWGAGLISGMFFIGVAEIIHLLENILLASKEKGSIINQPEKTDRVNQDVLPSDKQNMMLPRYQKNEPVDFFLNGNYRFAGEMETGPDLLFVTENGTTKLEIAYIKIKEVWVDKRFGDKYLVIRYADNKGKRQEVSFRSLTGNDFSLVEQLINEYLKSVN